MADLTLVTDMGAVEMSFPTSTDLSEKQYYVVKLDANEKVVLAGANDKALGVLQNAPDGSSDTAIAQVRIGGVTKVKTSETLAFGNFLTPTSTGTAEICDAASEEFFGKSLTSADANDLALCLLGMGEVVATDA